MGAFFFQGSLELFKAEREERERKKDEKKEGENVDVSQSRGQAAEESVEVSPPESQDSVDSIGVGVPLKQRANIIALPAAQRVEGNVDSSPSTSSVVLSGGPSSISTTATDAFQVLLDDNKFNRVLSTVGERCSSLSGAELFRVMGRISALQAKVAAAGVRALNVQNE
jgi:hypothetical protein